MDSRRRKGRARNSTNRYRNRLKTYNATPVMAMVVSNVLRTMDDTETNYYELASTEAFDLARYYMTSNKGVMG